MFHEDEIHEEGLSSPILWQNFELMMREGFVY
jgi:hypothetical protein